MRVTRVLRSDHVMRKVKVKSGQWILNDSDIPIGIGRCRHRVLASGGWYKMATGSCRRVELKGWKRRSMNISTSAGRRRRVRMGVRMGVVIVVMVRWRRVVRAEGCRWRVGHAARRRGRRGTLLATSDRAHWIVAAARWEIGC